jgi:hypothetical protein
MWLIEQLYIKLGLVQRKPLRYHLPKISGTYMDLLYIPIRKIFGLLIFILISENQGLEKSRPERIYNSHYGNGVPAIFTS